MKGFLYIVLFLSHIGCLFSKPPKEELVKEDTQFKEYEEAYLKNFPVYIDSVVRTFDFCFTTDTAGVLLLRLDIIQKNDKIAAYKKGTSDLMSFLMHSVRYPSLSRENGVEGKVILKFIVSENGEICNVSVVKTGGVGLAEEAIRVLSLTKGQWNPAELNAAKVKSYVTFPIVFKLQ